ncbi:hypothetical protein C8J57DRAFT_1491957 [Mycena rebaudengoi]|nr:hypothetical protein C8J57DRAFT_1491957 [Mycena rebaudengoi]
MDRAVSAVGLVASILQLVAAAKSVIDPGRDVVNATKDQRDLLLEVQNLAPLLEDLKYRLQQPNNQLVNGIQKLEKPLGQLKETMENITRKLGSANKVGSKPLIWTFWNKKEIDEDMGKIERFKAVLNAWLLLDTWDVGQQQEKNHSRLLTEVINLAQNEQDFHGSAGSALSEISKTLSSSSNTQRQDNDQMSHKINGKPWIVQNVKKSLTGYRPSISSHGTQIYSELDKREPADGCWRTLGLEPGCYPPGKLSGALEFMAAGAGKTVLASIIVEYLRNHLQSDGVAVAAAYLNHKESEVQSPSNILADLWWQLVSERPISASVQKLYQKHQKQRTRPSLDEVCNIVHSTITEWSKVFIVVEALDESPEAHRRILLNTLTTIGAVSLLLTSRPNIAPKSFFPTALVLEIRAREEDIRRYIDAHIQTSSRLLKHVQARPELRAEIESKIISTVDGMQVLLSFLLAKFHMDSLAIKNTVKAVRDALKNLPEDLEHMYNEAMDRIESQNKDDREIARRALIWVANAKRPLSVHELCEALAIELGATTLDADACSTLNLLFLSDYIDRVQPTRFPHAQTEITLQCLTYISFEDFRGHRSQDNPSLYRKYKLLSYASHYCLVHAAGEPESLLRERIIDFLSDAHRWRGSPFLGGQVPLQWYYADWPLVPSKLWVAVIFGLQEITKHLLEFDQSISKEEKESALLAVSYWDCCPGVVRLLIKHGANVNAAGGYYGNALHAAAAIGHVSVVQELIANGIAVNTGGRHYSSALTAALQTGHEGISALLIENGAVVHDANALQVALKKGHNTVAQLLIKKGADAQRSLQDASAIGDIAVVQFLMEHGADVNLQGGFFRSALQAALANGRAEVVQLLLEHGADVNLLGGHYGTALQAASAMGKVNVVQLLLNHGADVNVQGGHYGTALQAAWAHGETKVVQLLLNHGANVNLQGGTRGQFPGGQVLP